MTNARQARQVFRPLLARHNDLVEVGPRMLWLKPVHHLGLRVFIERSSDAESPSPQWNIIELFFYCRNIKIALGHRNFLFRSRTPFERHWDWSNPTTVDELVSAIEGKALPLLRSKQHFETFAAYYYFQFRRSGMFMHAEDCLIVDIAMGNLREARKKCEELLPEYVENKYVNWRGWQKFRIQVMTVAEPLMAGDRAALAEILHGWEYDNVKGSMLEPYWERTPFPLELSSG